MIPLHLAGAPEGEKVTWKVAQYMVIRFLTPLHRFSMAFWKSSISCINLVSSLN